jgi:uncharacterized protein YfaP (DUF2135 family)
MSWKDEDRIDVDLHVVDPLGQTYYFNKRRFLNNNATFIVDSINVNKGSEVWITTELKPGIYKIYYHFYRGIGFVDVNCEVFTKSFTKKIPMKRLASAGIIRPNRVFVAEIIVDEDGNADLRLK